MKPITASVLALALSVAAGSAFAGAQDYGNGAGYDSRYGDSRYGNDRYDNSYDNGRNRSRSDVAQVTRVVPIVDEYASYQRQECWNEQTNDYDDGYYRDGSGRLYYRDDNHNNTDRAIIGGIIGGALGNQVGKGDGRTAATIAGVVIGASIGNNTGRSDGYDRYSDNTGVVRRCRTVTDHGSRQNFRGYDVTYRYAGQTYRTVTSRHPGRTMRVLVDVRPQDNSLGYRP